MKCKEDLEEISQQLECLYDTLDVVSLGLQYQGTQNEVISCMGTISHCINDIKNSVDLKLHKVMEKDDAIKQETQKQKAGAM